MSGLPTCPECGGTYTYEDGNLLICPECSHEWSRLTQEIETQRISDENAIKDGFGNELAEGDNATIIKDIKISGSSEVIKQGTKVQNIRVEKNGPHNIVAKVDGFGTMELKSELIKKV